MIQILKIKTLLTPLVFAVVLLGSPAHAVVLQTGCATDYPGGTAPDVLNDRLLDKLRELCFTEFGIFHSGLTATPLTVAQHLTAQMVEDGKRVDREDVFHAETRLPESERSELAHYRGSGYDRGHLAPAADMATVQAQDESFSLSNMIPQLAALNRGPWAKIEATTRDIATNYGEVFVISGPVFAGQTLNKIGGRVLVPSGVYKAIYIPSTGQSSAWFADNANGTVSVVSIAELARLANIDVFPAVPAASKAARVSLPVPNALENVKAPVSTQKGDFASSPKKDTGKEQTWGEVAIDLFDLAKQIAKWR